MKLQPNGRHHSIDILPKTGGHGSSINGGELLFAALAICFCNDLYREAAKRTLSVRRVDVEVTGTFGQPGDPAQDISYRAKVDAEASQSDIDELIRATDNCRRNPEYNSARLCGSTAGLIGGLV